MGSEADTQERLNTSYRNLEKSYEALTKVVHGVEE